MKAGQKRLKPTSRQRSKLDRQRLITILDQMRLIPPDVPLLSIQDAHRLVESVKPDLNSIDKAERALNECLRDKSLEFVRFVWGKHAEYRDILDTLEDAISRYERFRTNRATLGGLALMNRLRPGRTDDYRIILTAPGDSFPFWILEDEVAMLVHSCLNCGHIFFVVRKKQEWCKSECARALRNRRYYEKNHDTVNSRWRQNYDETYRFRRNGVEPLTRDEHRALESKKRGGRHPGHSVAEPRKEHTTNQPTSKSRRASSAIRHQKKGKNGGRTENKRKK